ncbi:hypothetical protein ACS0TY_005913 [Phlomoides rotata]
MERLYNFNSSIQLPPGFRFHPTDEELVTRYLSPKALDSSFSSTAIGEVDLNKIEPWDLPWKSKIGEKEWYFFCVRYRKNPNGSRANRATCTGYWKATGKDKEIFRANKSVGMKKTLVFYLGRAPKGEKTNWVMHEYRLPGNNSFQNLNKIEKIEWVICRIFKKSAGGKKVHISRLVEDRDCRLDIPPLSSIENRTTTKAEGSHHLTCFSITSKESLNKSFDEYLPNSDSIFSSQLSPTPHHSMLRVLLESNNSFTLQNAAKTEFSDNIGINTDASNHEVPFKPYDHELGFKIYDDDQDFPIDCLWNY